MHAARGLAAVIEVLLAFALVHVTFRAIKHFTAIGAWERAAHTNFTPGAVMILFTAFAVFLGRRDPNKYGLTLHDWRRHLGVGVVACAVLGLLSLAAIDLTNIRFDPTRPPDMMRGIGGAIVGLIATFTIVWLFPGNAGVTSATRIPWLLRWRPSLAVVISLLSIPVIIDRNSLPTVLWLFFGAGFGEEIFYRGYIQSRVTEAFERPWPAVLVSSLLFGFLHALNTVDYFRGRWDFAWWYALQSVFIGLFYGVLRARTGSVLPGAIAHGLSDVLAQVLKLLRG